jgi:hypothetical protein
MDDQEREAFYATEYRLLNEGSATPTTFNTAVQNARAESLTAFIKPITNKVINHLDIGCSMGILLNHLRKSLSLSFLRRRTRRRTPQLCM